MKIYIQRLFYGCVVLLLTACEPTIFGMPQAQFDHLPRPQQQQVIDSYNRQQEIRLQNEPVNALVDQLGVLVRKSTKKRYTVCEDFPDGSRRCRHY